MKQYYTPKKQPNKREEKCTRRKGKKWEEKEEETGGKQGKNGRKGGEGDGGRLEKTQWRTRLIPKSTRAHKDLVSVN